MPTAGPNSAGTGANDNSYGTIAWSNPGNITVSDNTRAITSGINTGTTNYLKATNFGFSLPGNAIIDGIKAEFEVLKGVTGGGTSCQTDRVRVIKGGTIQTAQTGGSMGQWPSPSDAYESHGGASDLWGVSWTAADINASNFGFVISASLTSSGGQVDHVRVTVYYSYEDLPPATFAATVEIGVAALGKTHSPTAAIAGRVGLFAVPTWHQLQAAPAGAVGGSADLDYFKGLQAAPAGAVGGSGGLAISPGAMVAAPAGSVGLSAGLTYRHSLRSISRVYVGGSAAFSQLKGLMAAPAGAVGGSGMIGQRVSPVSAISAAIAVGGSNLIIRPKLEPAATLAARISGTANASAPRSVSAALVGAIGGTANLTERPLVDAMATIPGAVDLRARLSVTREGFAPPLSSSAAAAGPIAFAIERLREMVAKSTTFQNRVGAASWGDALFYVWRDVIPEGETGIHVKRPFAVVTDAEELDYEQRSGGAAYRHTREGSLYIYFTDKDRFPNSFDDAWSDFRSAAALVLDEVMELSAVDENLTLVRGTYTQKPQGTRYDRIASQTANEGETYFDTWFRVRWRV